MHFPVKLLWIYLGLLCSITDAVKVSFFGASHVIMPLQEAKLSTNIRLKFRGRQENAVIFLTAGRTDHCLLSLHEGRIKFDLKIDEYETEMWSPKALLFNDLVWHDIVILRYETNLTLQVDEHFVRRSLPIDVGELNVHFGVSLGGVGDFTDSYLRNLENYRGCISDVYYNNINVLKRAREKTGHITTEKIAWNCAPEFDAGVKESISFTDNDSFIIFRKAKSRNGDSWSMEFRTIEVQGTLLYNIESSNRYDYMALEILDSKLRLLVGKGSNAVELVPDRNVSDGKWHNVSINYNPSSVEIIVDDLVNSASFANGSSNYLELSDEFYIGGLEEKKRRRAAIKGFRANDISFRGCVRNIVANSQAIGFPQMKVTNGVAVDCVWKYPCIEKQPCILSGNCQQQGIDEFICYCDQAFCIRADFTDPYKIFTRSDLPEEIPLLAVAPMQVLEGDSIFLSKMFADVVFDFTKFKLQESNILFHIIQPPKHGKLSVLSYGNVDSHINETQSKFFSYIDLSTDKVKYTHNGMDAYPTDHMMIDLQIAPNGKEPISELLEGKHRFVLHVNVTPVNDAPTLILPHNKVLRLTQAIPKVLDSNLLRAEDSDSPPASLIYTVLLSQESEGQNGRVEVNGKAVTSFSQLDVDQGHVTYLVNAQSPEDTSFEIAIQVSDGMETSPAAFLRVTVLPLQLRMMNNTGLVLIHKSYSLITPWNLSFSSNSEDENLDIKFDIEQPPRHGSLQKFRSVDSSWISIESFTSNQLLLAQIRYIHTSSEFPQFDEFKFTASLGPVKTSVYDFRITFTKLRIGIQRRANININGTKEVVVKNDYLYHQTTPLPTFSRSIIYTLMVVPSFGVLYVEGHPETAKPGDSITQHDIDKNLIKFKTHQTSYSKFVDHLEFIITVPECEDVPGKIEIIYHPLENLMKQLTYQKQEKLYVNEGDRAAITRLHFEVLFNKFSSLTFNLTNRPKHGYLCLYNDHFKEQIEAFTIESLYLGDIFYCHDDSESAEDSMKLLILSDEETDFQFVSEIKIGIHLQNDNAPNKLIDKKFTIVREDTKVISINDLKYADPDLNAKSSDIYFKHVICSNGEVLMDGKLTSKFSQDDIEAKLVYFKHYGADLGNISFIVSDGLFDISGVLEIEASEPYLKIRESNASVVQEGRIVIITPSDLKIDTNLNVKPEEIEYRILTDPSHGFLKLYRRKVDLTQVVKVSDTISLKNFTQMDVDRERIAYLNNDVASMDKLKYRVAAKGVWTEGEILIRIYPSAYWESLQIRKNETLYVEESTSIQISRETLEIGHPNISPGDITYLVTTSPQHGYLEIQSITSDDEYNSKVFDQSTINSEKMFYIQAGVNQSSDYFMFDVTNGIEWLRNMVLKIVIIPENLYIKTNGLVVEEGKSIKLSPDNMVPYSEFYIGKIIDYKILEHPRFGNIRSGKSSKINRFTQKQLEAGVVYYIHSGSEDLIDVIKLVAFGRNKESLPFSLDIVILPVNDEIPQVVTNTGLQMWIGGKSVLKNTDLMARDHDSAPENLTFYIQHLSGGYLTYKDIFNKKIHNFTQNDINHEQIYFIHDSNHINGEFIFYVTDGVHNTTEQILHITSNPIVLEIERNEYLHVFPLTRKQILAEQLHYKCSDQDREIKYIVTVPPQMGRLIYEYTDSGYTNEVFGFTQEDIENGRIFYEHTSPMVELKSNDSFFFDVTAQFANSLIDQIFNIDISVSSGGLLRFLPVPRIILDEGDIAPVKLDLSKVLEYLETRAGIFAPELYIEAYKPAHGQIETMDSRKDVNKFTLNDFYTNKVYYRHDHSDTVEDKIAMAVYLLPGNIFLCNITIPVTINPINDQPFYLVTISPQVSVIEGENKTITNADLLTEDADTSSRDLIYDIISGPTQGILLKISDEGYPQDIITYGNQFTQADINENRIIYTHTGNPQSTTFYFKVSDGKFKPAYEIFNIKILPIQIYPGAETVPINVQQGSNAGVLEPKNVAIETNVQKNRLMYNITRLPYGGILANNNKQVFRFNQRQLEDGVINYVQNDMTRSNDSFQVNAYIPDTTSFSLVDIQVVVQPFIIINPVSITPGSKVRLSSTFIIDNPTQLKLNRYNPKITISRKPKYGKFKKIIRSTGDLESVNDKEIFSFTYKELKSGVVYFVARKFFQEFSSINDSFEYILTTKTAQPSQGVVNIEIFSPNKISTDDNPEVIAADTRITVDHLLILSIITGILIFLFMAIMIIRCRSINVPKDDPDKNMPPALPRPPDFMTLHTTRSMYTPSENDDSLPVTQSSTPLPVLSNVPHCKVIPIGIDSSIQDSDPEDMIDMREDALNNANMLRYVYNDDPEDWSSCGPDVNYSSIAQPQQIPKINPLLRRNQYWV